MLFFKSFTPRFFLISGKRILKKLSKIDYLFKFDKWPLIFLSSCLLSNKPNKMGLGIVWKIFRYPYPRWLWFLFPTNKSWYYNFRFRLSIGTSEKMQLGGLISAFQCVRDAVVAEAEWSYLVKSQGSDKLQKFFSLCTNCKCCRFPCNIIFQYSFPKKYQLFLFNEM